MWLATAQAEQERRAGGSPSGVGIAAPGGVSHSRGGFSSPSGGPGRPVLLIKYIIGSNIAYGHT